MDPIHIHNLLRQLANEVHCPHCNSKVRPDMIHVENSTQNYCLLRIDCFSCGETFHGHAHVGVKVTDNPSEPGKKAEKISNNLPPSPPAVTEADIKLIKECLDDKSPGVARFFSRSQ